MVTPCERLAGLVDDPSLDDAQLHLGVRRGRRRRAAPPRRPAAIPSARIVPALRIAAGCRAALARELRRRRDHEVRRRPVAGRRDFVQAVEHVEEVEEEVEAVEPAAERQLVADRQVDGERAGPADAVRHRPALGVELREDRPRQVVDAADRPVVVVEVAVDVAADRLVDRRAADGADHGGEGERPPRVPAAAGREHVGAVGTRTRRSRRAGRCRATPGARRGCRCRRSCCAAACRPGGRSSGWTCA